MDETKETNPVEIQAMVERIGSLLRQKRKEKKWSLDELADKTGVSKLTLGKIERGETNPSLAVMWRIADGLAIPLSALFLPEQGVLVSRPGTGPHFTEGPWRIEPMFPGGARRGAELYRAFLQPNSSYTQEFHPGGVVETATVLSGSVQIEIGSQLYELEAYDSVRFRGDSVHSYKNPSGAAAVLQLMLEYPDA